MGHHIGPGSIIGIATVALVVMAIFIIIADDRLRNTSGFDGDQDLQDMRGKLIAAQILTWISAGLALLLTLGYLFPSTKWIDDNEWIHLILWLAVFGTLIAAIILLALGLGDLDRSTVTDDNDTGGYTWTALGIGIGAFVILLISGGWRIIYQTNILPNQKKKPKTYHMLKPQPPVGAAERPHTIRVSNGGSKTQVKVGPGYESVTSTGLEV